MPIEITTTFEGLNALWPNDDPDPIGSWDDHMRLIKDVWKKQFPGSGGAGYSRAISAYESELNQLQGLSGPVQAQLDALSQVLVPIGGIIMYSGLFSAIPANYALCNGGAGTPDLSSDFIYGTNIEGEVGTQGGTADQVNVSHVHDSAHSHTASLSTDGSHGHTFTTGTGSPGTSRGDANGTGPFVQTETTSVNGDHTHTLTISNDLSGFSTDGADGTGLNIPPFIKLAYIQRQS